MSQLLSHGLPLLKDEKGQPALCLVTGATGYIGGRLIVELLAHGYRVRVLARNSSRLKNHPWINQVEVFEGDAQDEAALSAAMAGADVAYYLLHALMAKDHFEDQERAMAELFGKVAKAASIKRLVYLGGIIAPTETMSPHLQARADTGEILRNCGANNRTSRRSCDWFGLGIFRNA